MLTLSILADTFAICRLGAGEEVTAWALIGDFGSITHTSDELSIVCAARHVPAGVRCDPSWCCLKVEGPLELSLTGVLSSLTTPLAEARINLFAIWTFDTDYLLVKEQNLTRTVAVLSQAGHAVRSPGEKTT